MNHHFLILTWAEDPDDPRFGGDLDWTISHPPECLPKLKSAWGQLDYKDYDCAIQWELDNVGTFAFGPTPEGRIKDWADVPSAFPIEHYAEELRFGWETEWETGLRLVGEPK